MSPTAGRDPLDELGSVLTAPGRLRILEELLAGPALPAGALAARVGLAPSTVSSHLARLAEARLIRVDRVGRTRLAQLADEEVAEAVEALLRLSGEPSVSSLSGAHRRTALRTARSCYDHLAGQVGVALADAGVRDGWLVTANGTWGLRDDTGEHAARALGLRLDLAESARPLVRPCLDWTERRPHLAGRLGRAVLDAMLADGWVQRRRHDRALKVTPRGRDRLSAVVGELAIGA
ncbi:MAG TPA: helix-turn-helix domain-containing protein [Phototrophicaceae bacterium]|nr:helix-turn-helix domain-containing protein [Phototrophicaceae bacterium]